MLQRSAEENDLPRTPWASMGGTIPHMDGMAQMWQAVVIRAVEDLRGTHLFGEDRTFARDSVAEWVGTPDFVEVCTLAGLDPVATEIAMTKEIADAQVQ